MDQAAHGVHGLKIPCIPSLLETVQMLQLSYRCIFRCPPSLAKLHSILPNRGGSLVVQLDAQELCATTHLQHPWGMLVSAASGAQREARRKGCQRMTVEFQRCGTWKQCEASEDSPCGHLKPYHEHPAKKTSISVGRRTTGDEFSGSKPEDYQNHIPAVSDASCINSNLGTNRLTQQTERVLEQEKKPVTPYNLALVMFALGVSGHKYTQGHSPVE
ncbi:uncharacterized protein [Equus przewalskii]|uniref:Uncharacterized protein isoform X1 n=1 Tax=Equus przewalskii TaxID=9798 RepID=A0ABM4NYJ4_EQUPR